MGAGIDCDLLLGGAHGEGGSTGGAGHGRLIVLGMNSVLHISIGSSSVRFQRNSGADYRTNRRNLHGKMVYIGENKSPKYNMMPNW